MTGDAAQAAYEVGLWWDALLGNAGWRVELPRLSAMIQAAARQPRLRQLLPYTSHDDLRFSRCTQFPYTTDTPWVCTHANRARHWGERDLLYEVHVGEFSGGNQPVATTSDPDEAAAIVVSLLPPDCGPAVPGSADLATGRLTPPGSDC